MEDAAVAVVLHLVGGIDPALGGEGELRTVGARHLDRDVLPDGEPVAQRAILRMKYELED